MAHRPKILTNTRLIALGFLVVILIGAMLLSLPISSKSGEFTNFGDTLFISTSATCVTGLSIFDTYAQWTFFGQAVILVLIQIGGLGFMTVITMFSLFARRRIGLEERTLLMQTAGTIRHDGIISLIRRILIGTALFETLGTIILSFSFCPKMGFFEGVWNALFHSVSAFCNAGFDLMGKYENASLMSFYDSPLVILTISALIIIGGIGFLVWSDICKHGIHIRRYSLHARIVLTMTTLLLVVGFVFFYVLERNGEAFAGMSEGEKILSSFFLSVTPRTAGFNSVDMAALSESSILLTMFLMFVGAASGSTAGGIKVTTFAVLILATASCTRRNGGVIAFKRRLEQDIVRKAAAIGLLYLFAIVLGSFFIAAIDRGPTLTEIIFEVVSALGTVGLSRGITAELSAASHGIHNLLMIAGRVGALSFMMI